MKFGEYLYAIRMERGWTLRHAAKMAGIAFSRLGEIEKGIDPHNGKAFVPNYVTVCRLARAYELPLNDLLTMAGHEPGIELTEEEWKLLAAWRRCGVPQRQVILDSLDRLDGHVAAPAAEV